MIVYENQHVKDAADHEPVQLQFNNGHYIAYLENAAGRQQGSRSWVRADDDEIHEVEETAVLARLTDAVLLYYEFGKASAAEAFPNSAEAFPNS